MDLSMFSEGTYIVKVVMDKDIFTKKINVLNILTYHKKD